jgi:hypothetical protein
MSMDRDSDVRAAHVAYAALDAFLSEHRLCRPGTRAAVHHRDGRHAGMLLLGEDHGHAAAAAGAGAVAVSARLVAACVVRALVTAGCAQKTDWIEGPLVTVDVSVEGTVRGAMHSPSTRLRGSCA